MRVPEAKSVLKDIPLSFPENGERVMIAMAVSCNPALIIADEPTTALDVTVEKQIIKLMRDIMRRFNSSLIWISHDLDVVKQVCGKIAVMYGGIIVEIGSTEDILSQPLHPYTRALMDSQPSVSKRGRPLQSIEGFVPNMLNIPDGCIFDCRCLEKSGDCCQGTPPALVELDNGRRVACRKYL